jgi:hypothetical protein
MTTQTRSFVSQLAAGLAVVASCAATPALADAPQAVTIVTHVTFDPNVIGTFEATGPICSTGTVFPGELQHIGAGPAAFNANGTTLFVCDDNSGTFVMHAHPQANARPKDGFTLNGPWAIKGDGGTGVYAKLSGQGDFGVVLDFSADPVTGVETYVGFVTLK